jgi:HD superfamily phosphohydrolase
MSIEFRDPLHGTISLNDAETEVVNSPEFQRLRAIKQLGFADFSFPGATHTRFLHSLGVFHLAGLAFDQVFKNQSFSKNSVKARLRQCFKLSALLHDVGHGPLSHTTEEVMPLVKDLNIKSYQHKVGYDPKRKATHEDYTIKYITDSNLSEILQKNFSDLSPYHISMLIDKSLKANDDFFIDQNIDFRPILSQLVSSEIDVDRMDYLERDSYYTGTNYGKFDRDWMLSNLIPININEQLYLALNRRALYTFDDFLISRHHIHLMVYFHHKCIVFEEMLNLYLDSKDCDFRLPSDINDYTRFTDYRLYEHLAASKNEWARRVALRNPYKVIIELHNSVDAKKPSKLKKALEEQGLDVIWSSSKTRLSKYHQAMPEDSFQIYVVDQYDRWDKPTPIDKSTQIFQKYEAARIIDRLYVAPEKHKQAEKILKDYKL